MAEESGTPQQVPQINEEEIARKYLKEKYGLEQDPELFKKTLEQLNAKASRADQYDQAVQAYYTQQSRQANNPDTPVNKPTDEHELRDLWRTDPYEGWNRSSKLQEERLTSAMQRYAQAIHQSVSGSLQARETEEQAASRLRGTWPEAYDSSSELHKIGSQIYWKEMGDIERSIPGSFVAAVERAAARLGLPPKDKRMDSNREEEIADQSVGSGGKRPSPDASRPIRLSDREKRMVEDMEIDPKIYAEQKSAVLKMRGGKK